MAEVNYDFTAIDNSINNLSTIGTNLNELTSVIDNFFQTIDKRIIEHYNDDFSNGLSTKRNDLDSDFTNCTSTGNWLSNTYSDLIATNAETNSIANSAKSYEGDSSFTPAATIASTAATLKTAKLGNDKLKQVSHLQKEVKKADLFNIDSKAWASLPGSVKTAIEAKLKELGFTAEEIRAIKNGEMSVNKTQLESLSAQLEKALKNNPDLREKLIKIYGFDIFNEDGSINKTKLAIAMLIDNKKPNDQYNLSNYIPKEQIVQAPKSTIESTNTTNPTTTTTNVSKDILTDIKTLDSNQTSTEHQTVSVAIPSENTPSPNNQNIHTGAAFSEDNLQSLDKEAEALLDKMTGKDEDEIIKGVATSVAGVKNRIPQGTINVKKSGVGVIPVAAGLTSSAAVAGGLTMANKKKDKEDSNSDDESLLEEELLKRSNEKQTSEEAKKQEDDKEWLYGLGIRKPSDN